MTASYKLFSGSRTRSKQRPRGTELYAFPPAVPCRVQAALRWTACLFLFAGMLLDAFVRATL